MIPLSRRHMLNGGLVAAAASISPRAAFAQDRIVLTDPGGSTQASYAKASRSSARRVSRSPFPPVRTSPWVSSSRWPCRTTPNGM